MSENVVEIYKLCITAVKGDEFTSEIVASYYFFIKLMKQYALFLYIQSPNACCTKKRHCTRYDRRIK